MSSQGITFKISDKKPEIFNPKEKFGVTLTTPADLIKATWEASTRKDDWMRGRLQYSKCKGAYTPFELPIQRHKT
jgi:hypothetical protein